MPKKPPKSPKNKIKDRLDKAQPVTLEVIEGGKSAPGEGAGEGHPVADGGDKKHGGDAGQPVGARQKTDGGTQEKAGGAGETVVNRDGGLQDSAGIGDFAGYKDDGPPESLSPEELELVRKCAELDQNDRDNGRRLVRWCGDDLIYVVGLGWLTWRGTHWQRDEGELQARLKAQNLVDKIKLEPFFIGPTEPQTRLLEAAERAAKKTDEPLTREESALIAKAAKARDQLRKKKTARRTFAVSSGNSAKTAAMLAQASSLLAVDQDMLDTDLMAINLQNGTLKFTREKHVTAETEMFEAGVALSPHKRSDLNTKRANVNYDPSAACPVWDEFLAMVHPDPDIRLFLQVFHGYALLGGNAEHKLIFHYGSGANGKSVFMEALGRLCGEYRAVVSPDTLTGNNTRGGQQASPDIARLFNARVATIEELPRGTPLKESFVKSISGGSKQTARFLNQEIFEFDPLFTAIMSGNDMPEISGTDDGIWRRLLLVKWGIKIPDKQQDTSLPARLDAERDGILNWLVDGVLLYLENGLTRYIPASVSEFASEYRQDKDPVGQFAEACLRDDDGGQVQAKDMYQAFLNWAEFNAIKPWQQKAFGTRLTALGYKKDKGRVYQYLNVRLHKVPDPHPEPQGGFYNR